MPMIWFGWRSSVDQRLADTIRKQVNLYNPDDRTHDHLTVIYRVLTYRLLALKITYHSMVLPFGSDAASIRNLCSHAGVSVCAGVHHESEGNNIGISRPQLKMQWKQ